MEIMKINSLTTEIGTDRKKWCIFTKFGENFLYFVESYRVQKCKINGISSKEVIVL